MRIVFRVDDVEYQGETRDLSTHGVFVVGRLPQSPESIEKLDLLLESADSSLPLAGEVVRVTPEGFAVAFSLLKPETIEKLDDLAHPSSSARKIDDKTVINSKMQTGQGQISVDLTSEWRPPVCEPVLHQWMPDSKLVPPSPGEPHRASWESLPTISPPVEIVEQPEADENPPAPEISLKQPESDRSQGSIAAPSSAPTPLEASILKQANAEGPRALPEESPSDRRENERLEQSIPVTFDNLTGLIKEFTHNISFGGLFVYTGKSFEKGTEVAVTLVHPVHGERLTLLARVAHSSRAPSPDPLTGRPRYGIGVQFRIPLEELKRMLSGFISSHKQAPKTGEPLQVISEARQLAGRDSSSERELLGVSAQASQDEIRRAYFSLVDRFHPDRYYGKVEPRDLKLLEDLFKKLTSAYETLTS